MPLMRSEYDAYHREKMWLVGRPNPAECGHAADWACRATIALSSSIDFYHPNQASSFILTSASVEFS